MCKKLIAMMLSAILIASCGCGAAQNSTAAQSSGAAQESEAVQDSEAAQEGEAAKDSDVTQDSDSTQDSTALQSSESTQDSAASQDSESTQDSAEAQASAETEDPAASTAVKAAAEQAVPEVEAGIYEISRYGNMVLTIGADSMTSLGYETGDIVLVKIGNAEMEMPIGTNYTDADIGKPLCAFRYFADGTSVVVLMINGGNLAETMGIAEQRTIEEDPGYEWIYTGGLDETVPVIISMAQKQGYADEYEIHQLSNTLSNDRSSYPDLSDAEYANFRAVNTTGIGKDTLFRSSSPINPVLNRNKEADEALLTAMVRTIMNMSDSETEMRQFSDFGLTNYSECSVIALAMSADYSSEEFRQKLADGFRFLSTHKGPYLIHCIEGKDRTGYAVSILECLMGANADEIAEDYMLTFYNFYGVEPGSEKGKRLAAGIIEPLLAKTFEVPSIRDEGVDLQECAETYLMNIGMNDEEIAALKENLSKDYGGLN